MGVGEGGGRGLGVRVVLYVKIGICKKKCCEIGTGVIGVRLFVPLHRERDI